MDTVVYAFFKTDGRVREPAPKDVAIPGTFYKVELNEKMSDVDGRHPFRLSSGPFYGTNLNALHRLAAKAVRHHLDFEYPLGSVDMDISFARPRDVTLGLVREVPTIIRNVALPLSKIERNTVLQTAELELIKYTKELDERWEAELATSKKDPFPFDVDKIRHGGSAGKATANSE